MKLIASKTKYELAKVVDFMIRKKSYRNVFNT